MPPKRTPEELALILPAFSADGKPGVLESIVRARMEKTRNIVVDVPKLSEQYAQMNCPNVVKLIAYLHSEKGEVVDELGSGSIDLAGVTDGPFSIEAAQSLRELYIGSKRNKVSPLQWLAYLAEGLPHVLSEQIKIFDHVCGNLITMAVASHQYR